MNATEEEERLHSPYPGLRPFSDEDAILMYGRTAQISEITQRLCSALPVLDATTRIESEHSHQSAAALVPFDQLLATAERTARQTSEDATISASVLPEDRASARALTRFVAVLGGSGSGKSSLIRAGVVPALRQDRGLGIGDLWIPLVFTPGTNFGSSGGGQESADESPITRLALKFEAKLKPRLSEPEPAANDRRHVIATLLRKPGGLDRLLDVYGDSLAVSEDIQTKQARVLIVIDQFEELFHWSNQQVEDARHLIERVIDHYHEAKEGRGSSRCFVVITLRSEHLNDCARYMGLPDAINAGAYLVGRLDEAQLHEAIEKPAGRYLRLAQRRSVAQGKLPRRIDFHPEVIRRLLKDTLRLAESSDLSYPAVLPSDHLPLLQHVLARTWMAAVEREKVADGGIPNRIELKDLWVACDPASGGDPPTREENVLCASLQRWADWEYGLLQPGSDEGRPWLDGYLSRLAYKDPSTGTYNQQRLRLTEHQLAPEFIEAQIGRKWLKVINYFYLDRDDKSNPTLKVSHESFIRGWQHFKTRIDDSARRYEQFLALKQRQREWAANPGKQSLLMPNDLRRMDEVSLPRVLRLRAEDEPTSVAPEAWRVWQARLRQTPRSDGLAEVGHAQARTFYLASRKKEKDDAEREVRDAAKRARSKWSLIALASIAAVLATTAGGLWLYSTQVQDAIAHRASQYFAALARTNAAPVSGVSATIDEHQLWLGKLLMAAAEFEAAACRGASVDCLFGSAKLAILKSLDVTQLLPIALLAAEKPLNEKLRTELIPSAWRRAPPIEPTVPTEQFAPQPPITLPKITPCSLDTVDATKKGKFLRHASARGKWGGRGVLLLQPDQQDWRLHNAEFQEGTCKVGKLITTLPRVLKTSVVFDQDFRYFLLTLEDGSGVTVYQLADIEGILELSGPALARDKVIHDAARSLSGDDAIGVARAVRVAAGTSLSIGAHTLRTIESEATVLNPQPRSTDLEELGATTSSDCLEIGKRIANTEPPQETIIESSHLLEGYCLFIRTGGPQGRREAVLRAYQRNMPDMDEAKIKRGPPGLKVAEAAGTQTTPPVPAAYARFGAVPPGKGLSPQEPTWWAGKGSLDGWLISSRYVDNGKSLEYIGIPWSTRALRRLGCEVLAEPTAGACDVAPQPSNAASTPAVKPASGVRQ